MPPPTSTLLPTNLLSRRPFTDSVVTQRLEASRKYNRFKSTMWVGVRELTELLEDVQNTCADASDSSPPKNNYQQTALCNAISGMGTRLADPSTIRILASYLLTHGIPDVASTIVGSSGLEFINLDQLEAMGTRFNADNPPPSTTGDTVSITPLAIIESARAVFTAPPFFSSPSPNKPPLNTNNNTTTRAHNDTMGGVEEEASSVPEGDIQCISSMGNFFKPADHRTSVGELKIEPDTIVTTDISVNRMSTHTVGNKRRVEGRDTSTWAVR